MGWERDSLTVRTPPRWVLCGLCLAGGMLLFPFLTTSGPGHEVVRIRSVQLAAMTAGLFLVVVYRARRLADQGIVETKLSAEQAGYFRKVREEPVSD